MSHSHIQSSKPPLQTTIAWWKLALGISILVILVAVFFLVRNWMLPLPSAHDSANAKILEIRRVVDHTADSQFGSKIFYRFEAHVQYVADRQLQDRWLRIADDLPMESLLVKLADHPNHCLAQWLPDHPENARCSLRE
jgi:hypothetical protein